MTFRDLHDADLPLLLPNAWDVASALAFVEAGFPAIGTTSFGVAASAGRADGGRSSRDATRDLARRLSVLPAYVSADIEDGYDDEPERVAQFVAGLGVAGINIEDSSANELIDPARHAAKITAIKRANPDVYVNARVDTYWLGQDADVESTLDRARAYVAAGADGVFVPGASDPADLRAITSELPVPVNVLVIPALSLRELGELGVRRVSTGSLPYRAAIDAAVGVARGVRDGGEVPTATPYPAMQDRLVRFERLLSR
ncbi:isocitrate lyase/PEP mutase family protein [Rugosimonospora acidiphila]